MSKFLNYLSRRKYIFCIVFMVLFSFVLGFFVRCFFEVKNGKNWSESRLSGYHFINPLLECEDLDTIYPGEYKAMKDSIAEEIDRLKGDSVQHISLYFRDLNNGDYFGFDEKEKFTPASLLKVPIMMAYLKLAETHPDLLAKQITVTEDFRPALVEQNIQPGVTLVVGQKYTIEELIKIMIQYSDNAAAKLLLNNIQQGDLERIYRELSLKTAYAVGTENFMTVREYASFFRILYNATYLSKEMSEKALGILASLEFQEGLNDGVPSNVVIAHKFGERRLSDIVQFHDCGIVYYPNNPYLLCIMTRGKTFINQMNVVQKLSKKVYDGYNRMKQRT